MKLAALLFILIAQVSFATTTNSNIKYPELAIQNCIEGWVELELTIGLDGRVESAEVLKSKPPGIFDQTAVDAASQWFLESSDDRYKKTQTLDFRIDDSAKAECSQRAEQ